MDICSILSSPRELSSKSYFLVSNDWSCPFFRKSWIVVFHPLPTTDSKNILPETGGEQKIFSMAISHNTLDEPHKGGVEKTAKSLPSSQWQSVKIFQIVIPRLAQIDFNNLSKTPQNQISSGIQPWRQRRGKKLEIKPLPVSVPSSGGDFAFVGQNPTWRARVSSSTVGKYKITADVIESCKSPPFPLLRHCRPWGNFNAKLDLREQFVCRQLLINCKIKKHSKIDCLTSCRIS